MGKTRRCRVVILALAFMLVFAALPMSMEKAYGLSEGTSGITGEICTKDAYGSAAINYLLKKYPQKAKWTGGNSSAGYAKKVSEVIAGGQKSTTYTGSGCIMCVN